MYWIWLLVVVSLTLVLIATIPQNVLRTAIENCTRADSSKSLRRRQRETKQVLSLVGLIMVIPIILMVIHVSVAMLPEQLNIDDMPEGWVTEIERADTVYGDVNETLARFSEWHEQQQSHSYASKGSWKDAIWGNWMFFTAEAVLMGIAVYFFLGPYYLLLISNYTQGVERRHRVYSRIDRERSVKHHGELAEPQNGNAGPGDEIQRASNQDEHQEIPSPYMDLNDYIRELSREGFLDTLFNGLELPGKRVSGTGNKEGEHAAIHEKTIAIDQPSINDNGSPNNAIEQNSWSELTKDGLPKADNELQAQLPSPSQKVNDNTSKVLTLKKQTNELNRKIDNISHSGISGSSALGSNESSEPATNVALFCLMDTSSSMNAVEIDIAKRFFILLFLFLQRSNEHIKVIYVQHQATAEELEEDGFFESRQKSGTVVSSSLELMHKIILKRFADSKWEIYAAQVSDGDNKQGDSSLCRDILREKILPILQYYTYVETAPSKSQTLWKEYEILKTDHDNIAMQRIDGIDALYPKFRSLFDKYS